MGPLCTGIMSVNWPGVYKVQVSGYYNGPIVHR